MILMDSCFNLSDHANMDTTNQSLTNQKLNGFRTLVLPRTMATSDSIFSRDFYLPILSRSVKYCRGVGYFTSGWLSNNIIGVSSLVENGGTMSLIASVNLNKEDWDAVVLGDQAITDQFLYQELKKSVVEMFATASVEVLSMLSWLIADKKLSIKIARPIKKLDGDFHDKFGFFEDDSGDIISFNGSYNETAKGERNYDSIKIFKSWESGQEDFVQDDRNKFERIWSGQECNLKVYTIPESILSDIIKYSEHASRPYDLKLTTANKKTLKITPRKYQTEAILAWLNNGEKGIIKLATGMGKTITAILAINEFIHRNDNAVCVVICPYQHLVDQWNEILSNSGFDTIKCYISTAKWSPDVEKHFNNIVINKNIGGNKPNSVILLTTYDTFFSNTFLNLMKTAPGSLLLVFDECHHLNKKVLHKIDEINVPRLGLSATPFKFEQDDETDTILKYFDKIVYDIGLKDAIYTYKVLTEYDYRVYFVKLEKDDIEKYNNITSNIATIYAKNKISANEQRLLNRLLDEREALINCSAGRLKQIKNIFADCKIENDFVVFCSPRQIQSVDLMLNTELMLPVHKITYRETAQERANIMNSFFVGEYKGLTAIRCLDEGVDIPKIKTAIFGYSSRNPKEFIQRRGRILRRCQGKRISYIHDLLFMPPNSSGTKEVNDFEISMLANELRRALQFSSIARNRSVALNDILPVVYASKLAKLLEEKYES